MSTLKDQLLKAGLVKKAEVKRAPKKKAPTQAKKNRKKTSDVTQRAQRAMLDKAKKDKALNERRRIEAEKKALHAQIKQLVDSAKLDRSDGETSYNFTSKKKVKTIYVTGEQHAQLSKGQLAIVEINKDSFELVPKKAGEKIAQRDSSYIVKIDHTQVTLSEDDPYADYQIPDDLVW